MTTKIEWVSDSAGTQGLPWNPTTGCTKISAGCKNCYAKTMHRRLTAMGQVKYSEPFETVRFHPGALTVPLKRKKPTVWFVNSMSDLFHKDLSNEQIAAVFGVMAACPQHTFQVLTKRARRLSSWFAWASAAGHFFAPGDALKTCRRAAWSVTGDLVAPAEWPLPNVWIGVSVEDPSTAEARVPLLLETPAAVRFVSYEPALAGVDFHEWLGLQWTYSAGQPATPHPSGDGRGGWWSSLGHLPTDDPRIDQIIVGGESGHGARPCNIEWIRSVVEQCREAKVACFVKQLGAHPCEPRHGEWQSYHHTHGDLLCKKLTHKKGGDPSEWPEDLRVREFPGGTQ